MKVIMIIRHRTLIADVYKICSSAQISSFTLCKFVEKMLDYNKMLHEWLNAY